MNKPQRQTHIDELTGSQLHNKKNDILYCIESAKSVDAQEAYERQLTYIEWVIETRKRIYDIVNFVANNKSKHFTIEKYKDGWQVVSEGRIGQVNDMDWLKKYLLSILPVEDELYKQLALNLKQWSENQEKENGTQAKT